MRKITLELADSGMTALEAEARIKRMDPRQLLAEKLRADAEQMESLASAVNAATIVQASSMSARLASEIDGSQLPLTAPEDPLGAILRMQQDLKELASSVLGDVLRPVLPEALSSINTLLTTLAASTDSQLDQDSRRRARMAILESTRGSWAGEVDGPEDGVFYQEKMRAEWP